MVRACWLKKLDRCVLEVGERTILKQAAIPCGIHGLVLALVVAVNAVKRRRECPL